MKNLRRNINETATEIVLEHPVFDKHNFSRFCDELAQRDPILKSILDSYGYPPFWNRSNTFASLIHIILEQQVSLASAKAAFLKLKQKIGTITPVKVLKLSDQQLRDCYFSRQKTSYARNLAEALLAGKINLRKLATQPNDEVRTILKQIKGIGDWTVDVYLIFVLHRTNIFPVGDLAMVNALKEVKKLGKNSTKEHYLNAAILWEPFRTIATMILWHHYIRSRNIHL